MEARSRRRLGRDVQRTEVGQRDEGTRHAIEKAQDAAALEAIDYLRRRVPLVRKGRAKKMELAKEIGAAAFLHTVSRQTEEAALRSLPPDPNLRTHVVISMVRRQDGKIASPHPRQFWKHKRETEAVYHAALGARLAALGFHVERQTGTGGRYFEVAGVPAGLIDDWSSRHREIAERRGEWVAEFREKHGRDPGEQELRDIAVRHRVRKAKLTANPREHWLLVGQEHGFTRDVIQRMRVHKVPDAALSSGALVDELLSPEGITREHASFTLQMLRTEAMVRATGRLGVPDIERAVEALIQRDEVVPVDEEARQWSTAHTQRHPTPGSNGLSVGVWTTREMLALESDVLTWRIRRSALEHLPPPSRMQVWSALRAGQRAGVRFDGEQLDAFRNMVTERTVALRGSAGSGKGAVLAAAGHVWHAQGRRVYATAVNGATAQRLGQTLDGEALTMDALIRRLELHVIEPRRGDVFVVDEAGMVDTRRWSRLAEAIGQEATVVLVGDHAQVSPITAGGLWPLLSENGAQLSRVYRTGLQWQREAWGALREGRSEEALAAYAERGHLSVSDTRSQALTAAVEAWDRDGRRGQIITDASNAERHAANEQAQRRRIDAGELGATCVMATCDEGDYALHEDDRVIFRAQVRGVSGKPLEGPTNGAEGPTNRRIENGTTGTVVLIPNPIGSSLVVVRTDEPEPREVTVDPTASHVLLNYAGHVQVSQGATLPKAFVVTGGWSSNRNSIYTALSRSREASEIFVDQETLGRDGDADALAELAERAQRDGGKVAASSHLPREERADNIGRKVTRRPPTRPLADRFARTRERMAARRQVARAEYRPMAEAAEPEPVPVLSGPA